MQVQRQPTESAFMNYVRAGKRKSKKRVKVQLVKVRGSKK
jgi:hypothetical protein